MKKILEFFVLPVAHLLTIIVGSIIMILCERFNCEKNITTFLILLFALIIYYFFGARYFNKIDDRKIKLYSCLFTSAVLILIYTIVFILSYTVSSAGLFIVALGSPFADLIAGLFPVEKYKYLYEVLVSVLSPISVLIIIFFAKIQTNIRKYK